MLVGKNSLFIAPYGTYQYTIWAKNTVFPLSVKLV